MVALTCNKLIFKFSVHILKYSLPPTSTWRSSLSSFSATLSLQCIIVNTNQKLEGESCKLSYCCRANAGASYMCVGACGCVVLCVRMWKLTQTLLSLLTSLLSRSCTALAKVWDTCRNCGHCWALPLCPF